MTKKDIIRRIADDLGRTTIETAPIVQKTLDAIINVLAAEGRVELRNFGIFAVKRRKPRQARNPRTGEKIMVGERVTVTFKPGRIVEERVARECGGGAGEGVVAGSYGVGVPKIHLQDQKVGGMNAKKVATRITLGVLVAAVLLYAVEFGANVAVGIHKQSARGVCLAFVYRDLCIYRKSNGQWPGSLSDATKRQGSLLGEAETLDPISHLPLLYYPDAKPGTKAILLAQPEPLELGLWPFVRMKRLGIRADGRIVHLHGDESEDDDPE